MFPHRRHDDFHLLQPWSEFVQTAYSCSGSRPLIIFSLPDVIRLFLALSSSVRSNTSNAVALSIRDSPGEIPIDCTPQETLSTVFLSTNPFKFLSRLNVPAVNVFVPRSAQVSCCLECECFRFDHLLQPQRSYFQRFDLPDALASTDSARCRTFHVKRCFDSITKEHQHIRASNISSAVAQLA